MLLTPRLRPRSTGPALRSAPLPVTATVLSALTHGLLAVVMIVAASTWSVRQPKAYVVNLVPAVAAVGTPQGKPAPALPPRPEEPAPRVSQRTARELPERETPKAAPAPPPDLPARAPSLPDRSASLPDRSLPDRALPPRAVATPRAGEKELPPIASSSTTPRPSPAPATTARAEPPPPALGQPSGSAQGAGAMTLDVTDFPFAYYLASVQRKINERWEGRAQPGRQPVAVFEIGRNGQISKLAIEKTSGNPYYDQQALRAISEANPLPALPAEYPEAMLRIHLGFNFTQDRG
jgi:protein TonB